MAVAHQLACLGAAIGKAQAIDNVVKAALQHGEEVLTRQALAAVGLTEIAAETAVP